MHTIQIVLDILNKCNNFCFITFYLFLITIPQLRYNYKAFLILYYFLELKIVMSS